MHSTPCTWKGSVIGGFQKEYKNEQKKPLHIQIAAIFRLERFPKQIKPCASWIGNVRILIQHCYRTWTGFVYFFLIQLDNSTKYVLIQ